MDHLLSPVCLHAWLKLLPHERDNLDERIVTISCTSHEFMVPHRRDERLLAAMAYNESVQWTGQENVRCSQRISLIRNSSMIQPVNSPSCGRSLTICSLVICYWIYCAYYFVVRPANLKVGNGVRKLFWGKMYKQSFEMGW